jgi:hypothetical protein
LDGLTPAGDRQGPATVSRLAEPTVGWLAGLRER